MQGDFFNNSDLILAQFARLKKQPVKQFEPTLPNEIENMAFFKVGVNNVFRYTAQTINGKIYRKQSQFSRENLKDNSKKLGVSQMSAKKIKHAISYLAASATQKRVYNRETKKTSWFKLAFVTLTFPKIGDKLVDDKKAASCLHDWLVMAQAKWPIYNYFWKAETTAAGQIHFHITIDCFIHHKNLRLSWNRILNRKGLLDDFKKQHGHRDAPTTEIKAVIKVDNLAGYLIKYLSKTDKDRRVVSGRSWGCSQRLAWANRLVLEAPVQGAYSYDSTFRENKWTWKEIRTQPDTMGNTRPVGDLFFLDRHTWVDLKPSEMREDFFKYLDTLRPKHQQLFYEVDTFFTSTNSNLLN